MPYWWELETENRKGIVFGLGVCPALHDPPACPLAKISFRSNWTAKAKASVCEMCVIYFICDGYVAL